MGVDGVAIEVEVRVSSQLPRIDIVGLPEAAVRESAARVRAGCGGRSSTRPRASRRLVRSARSGRAPGGSRRVRVRRVGVRRGTHRTPRRPLGLACTSIFKPVRSTSSPSHASQTEASGFVRLLALRFALFSLAHLARDLMPPLL